MDAAHRPITVPLNKYLCTNLSQGSGPITSEEKERRNDACNRFTGFRTWDDLHAAWLFCSPYWGLVQPGALSYLEILRAIERQEFPVNQHKHVYDPIDEFILSWYYEHTTTNISLIATMVGISPYVSLILLLF
jgi:hypothetical protein